MIDSDRHQAQEIRRTPKNGSLGTGRLPAGWVGRLIPFEWMTTRGVQMVVLVDRIRIH